MTGGWRSQSVVPVFASSATNREVALPEPQRSTSGTKSRRCAYAAARMAQSVPIDLVQRRLFVAPSHATTRPAWPGSEDDFRVAEHGEDRCRAAVGPEDLAGFGVQDGERAARSRRVGRACVEPAAGIDGAGVDAAGAVAPPDRPGALVECVAPPDRAREDELVPDDRRGVHEWLPRVRQVTLPQLATVLGRERERCVIGFAVDAPGAHCEPARAVVSCVVPMGPADRTRRQVERDDVAAELLHVDRVRVGDRCRREASGKARLRPQREAPPPAQPPDVRSGDRRAVGSSRAGEVAVRERPGAAVAVAATAAEPSRAGKGQEEKR